MYIVHGDLITEMIRIDEEILGIMQDILNIPSDSQKELQKELYDYLKMFIKREKRLISKVPREIDFVDFIKDNINGMVIEKIGNPDNVGRVISRMSTTFSCLSSEIKPSEKYVTVFTDGKFQQYDMEEEYKQKLISIDYNKLLMKRYLKSLEDMKTLGIYENDILLAIQFLNLFIYEDLSEEFSNNSFDINKFDVESDEEFIQNYEINSQDFSLMKHDMVFSNIMILISLLLNNDSDDIDYKDAMLNFKYLIFELSYDELIELSEQLDTLFDSKLSDIKDEKIELIVNLNLFLEQEIDRKESMLDDKLTVSYESLSSDNYDKLVNLVSFERKLLSEFDKLLFTTGDNDLTFDKLGSLIEYENDYVGSIDFDSILLTDLNQFLNIELKEILNQDYYDREYRLINHRIGYLIPQFRNLFMSPSQSEVSHEMILRNFLADTLNEFYELTSMIEDEDIKENFLQLYKDRFFMYPNLTKELVLFKGNNLMIDSVSDDFVMEIAGIDDIELFYDINEQLFSEAKRIIEEFAGFDLSYLGSSYCQFRLIQFDYIVRSLNTEKLDILGGILIENTDIDDTFRNILSEMIDSNLIDADYDLNISFDGDKVLVKILKDRNV